MSPKSPLGQKLQPVAPGIACIKPTDPAQRIVPRTRDPRFLKNRKQRVDLVNGKGWMCLRGRLERLLNPDVKLTRSNFEPATSTRKQGRGFLNFLKPQQAAEKSPRVGFATLRGCYLHMIDVHHIPIGLSHGQENVQPNPSFRNVSSTCAKCRSGEQSSSISCSLNTDRISFDRFR